MNLFHVAVLVAALLQPTQAKEKVSRVVDTVNDDSEFKFALTVDTSLAPTDGPTIHPLKGTPLPNKCKKEFKDGPPRSDFCKQWLEVNDDFVMPTHSPTKLPTAAPTQFYNLTSSTFIGENNRLSLAVDISTVDDTFIEQFRPKVPLGDKSNLKIDAFEGAPTKVTMMKFNIGEAMNQVLLNKNVGVSLKSAKLHLYAKNTALTNQFGGYIEEIDTDWSEESAVWRDYVKAPPVNKPKDEKKDAKKLLPKTVNDTLASFEVVSPYEWAEADVTWRMQEIMAGWSDETVSQFAVRVTTDKSEGVVYASKENIQFAPKMSLVFEFEGTPLEVAAAAVAGSNQAETTITTSKPTLKVTSNPTNVPTVVPSPLPTPLPSSVPTSSPVLPTASPVIQAGSPVVATSSPFVSSPPSTSSQVADANLPAVTSSQGPSPSPTPLPSTALPTPTPSRAPSPSPTLLPTTAEVTEKPTGVAANTVATATSVVSQMFRLKIAATTEEVRDRRLKGTRELNPLMSLTEKELPALEVHLMNVYTESLTSSPSRVEVSFMNDAMDVEIVSDNEVVRSNAFKVIAIFLDPRIALIAANEASAVLDRATLHAFTGDEKTAFVYLLKETGDPIISSSEQISVDVSKMSFSIGNLPDQSIQAATAAAAANVKVENDTFNDAAGSAGWAGPALAIGASFVVIASALASFILIQQRRNQYSYDEDHKNVTKHTSPANTDAVTPSPTSFVGRFQKTKFDFTEFEDPEELSTNSKNLEYDFGPVAPQEMVQEQPNDFNCPSTIKLPHDPNRSFDDSTVSNVSAFMYSGMARSPQKNTTWADSEKSGIESQFQFDNLLGNDNDLQVYDSSPNILVDDDSAFGGDVPSELYNMTMDNMTMDDSVQSHDPIAIYGGNSLLENVRKARDASIMEMPPPPSDAASETSSQPDFPPDPFCGEDAQNETGDGERYQKAINDELNKVMMILNEPATEADKMESGGDDEMMYDVPYLQSAPGQDAADHTDRSIQSSVLSEDDPVKLMNAALDDCMEILNKARPNAEIV